MKTSLFDRTRRAPAGPPLDFAALTAALNATQGVAAGSVGDPTRAARPSHARADALANDDAEDDAPASRHVTVLLGREGWRQASRALGGRFAPAAGSRDPAPPATPAPLAPPASPTTPDGQPL